MRAAFPGRPHICLCRPKLPPKQAPTIILTNSPAPVSCETERCGGLKPRQHGLARGPAHARIMSIHALALALLATLNPPDESPDDIEPKDELSDQHFCCKAVTTDKEGKVGFGDDCALAEKIHIATCSAGLYCPGGYVIDQGGVTCPL